MQLPPKKYREAVFMGLFAYDSMQDLTLDPTTILMKELKLSKKNVCFALEKAQKIFYSIEAIDGLIASASEAADIDRIYPVEKNILRLCIFEMQFDNLEVKIAISEGIRLAKKFANPESAKFINGVLDRIYHECLKEPENQAVCTS